ncbi:MAG: hypothetical protein ACRC10_05955 [Thermoguttaceae bacterium]
MSTQAQEFWSLYWGMTLLTLQSACSVNRLSCRKTILLIKLVFNRFIGAVLDRFLSLAVLCRKVVKKDCTERGYEHVNGINTRENEPNDFGCC